MSKNSIDLNSQLFDTNGKLVVSKQLDPSKDKDININKGDQQSQKKTLKM